MRIVVRYCLFVTISRSKPRHADRVREAPAALAAEPHVGVRDLKARLSEYLRDVKRGATVVVTEHGRPIARIVPEPPSLQERLQALVQVGDIVWNGQPYAPAGPVARVRGSRTLADLIAEERDRR